MTSVVLLLGLGLMLMVLVTINGQQKGAVHGLHSTNKLASFQEPQRILPQDDGQEKGKERRTTNPTGDHQVV
ncbi:hypothetical protein QBC35DRAFT_503749 [Podospora australis]|uniref:Uncharacterized protein n=1 Tax=Podospora australis TaxID=1536484 RepID=A0AAN7AFI9_9PEZI|nr:hypothetical protein QBC35DRAFT_503749 [Podospora australis]